MCKFFSIIIAVLCLFSVFCLPSYAFSVSAKSAILIEENSGDIIYESNARLPLPMASTTKIMTALIAIENCNNLDKKHKIPKEATGVEGSSIYLKENEELSVRELLYALLLESANDASVALAIITLGNIDNFVEKMNEKALSLGLCATHFENPHGLDGDAHHSSAYDLAILTKYAKSNPLFCEIVSTKKITIPLDQNQDTRLLVNHNKLLRMYDGTNGVKTGFTKRAGRCLVSSCEKDGVSLICVTLNAPSDWHDHSSLFDYGFERYVCVNLAKENDYLIELNVQNGKNNTLKCTNIEPLNITIKRDDLNNIRASLEYNRPLYAPIKKGECVAYAVFYNGDTPLCKLGLYSLDEIKNINYKNFFERLITNGKN